MVEEYSAGSCPVSFVYKNESDFPKKQIEFEWPENSPNLNPIENSWAISKSQLQKLDCTTMTKLIELLFKYGIETLKSKKLSKTARINPQPKEAISVTKT